MTVFYEGTPKKRTAVRTQPFPYAGSKGDIFPSQVFVGSQIITNYYGAWLRVSRVGTKGIDGYVYLKDVDWTAKQTGEVPSSGGDTTYGWLSPDYMLKQYNYLPRMLTSKTDQLKDDRGFPATVPFQLRQFPKLDKSWQYFFFQLYVHSVFGHTRWQDLSPTDYQKVVKMFSGATATGVGLTTNNSKVKQLNYVTGEVAGAEPMRIGQLGFCRNFVELTSLRVYSKYGILWYQIRTLDVTKPPPDANLVNRAMTPALVHAANTSTPFKKDGEWVINPFPHSSNVGLGVHDHPMPLISVGNVNYVEVSRVGELVADPLIRPELQNPYQP